MQNAIIIVILICLVAVGVVYTVKHFKGEGGCCGGDSCKMKRKKTAACSLRKNVSCAGDALRPL